MTAAHDNDLPLRAEFNPLIRPYLVITIGFSIAITIIGVTYLALLRPHLEKRR